jgi:DoxX-like family
MSTVPQLATAPISKGTLWAGRIMSGLVILFLLFDASMKLAKAAPVLEAMPKVGWPAELAFPLGAILLCCTVLYIIPATAVLGAILLTGYLGGAVATHTRVGDPLFSHILFPAYLGLLMWGGLYARDLRLRALIPFRR